MEVTEGILDRGEIFQGLLLLLQDTGHRFLRAVLGLIDITFKPRTTMFHSDNVATPHDSHSLLCIFQTDSSDISVVQVSDVNDRWCAVRMEDNFYYIVVQVKIRLLPLADVMA